MEGMATAIRGAKVFAMGEGELEVIKELVKELSKQQLNNLAYLTTSVEKRVVTVHEALQELRVELKELASVVDQLKSTRHKDLMNQKSSEYKIATWCVAVMASAGGFLGWLFSVWRDIKP